MPLILRPICSDDLPVLCWIVFAAIHEGAAMHYDAAQCAAWCPAPPEPQALGKRLAGQSVTVAVAGECPVGFMTLRDDGYIDCAFVAPDQTRQGIGGALLRAVEREACERGMDCLTVEASLVARPLFTGSGWRVLREQVVQRNGVDLTNFAMEKRLDAG